MPKVNFYYNFKKDAWSWVSIAQDRELWGLSWKRQVDFIPDNLLSKIVKRGKKTAESLVYNHLISHPKRKLRQLIIEEEMQALEESWRKIENKFFKRLEKITQKPNFADSFKCYFSSGFMCPYNEKEKWFMVSMWHSIPSQITTIGHELSHFQFLHYYGKYCRRFLSKEKTEDLKEALTFLLNTDFNDLILSEDIGYPSHKKLRARLKQIWLREKNFKKFLDKAIKIVKN